MVVLIFQIYNRSIQVEMILINPIIDIYQGEQAPTEVFLK